MFNLSLLFHKHLTSSFSIYDDNHNYLYIFKTDRLSLLRRTWSFVSDYNSCVQYLKANVLFEWSRVISCCDKPIHLY